LERKRIKDVARAARAQQAKRALYDERPFIGCDGEGIGRGADHRYALFRMGERELYAADARLTSADLLAFIVDHPSPDDILVAFAFDYDVSNILRDLPADRIEFLLKGDALKTVMGSWTWVRFPGRGVYGVQYIPRNYLKVCRATTLPVIGRRGEFKTVAIPGTTRTIYDTWGFFQGSFLSALNRWQVGPEHWSAIKAGKDQRSAFVTITPAIRSYCSIECNLLAEMMGAFREACLGADIRPRTWNGAGKLASALMKAHKVIRAKELEASTPSSLLSLAHEAYYGGRFETTRCGLVAEPVHEFDLNSAYPAAMQQLPCLVHGRWRKASSSELARTRSALFVAPVHFRHPRETFICGLPIRSPKDGRLSWPREGRGVYWSPEIRSAAALGATINLSSGWLYERRCTCKPFAWIEALYEYRRSIGKAAKGIPLKLGYNSVYGKWAQRVGQPPYANPIYAGLCTAITRAKLNMAVASLGDPRRVVMMATDALYVTGRKPRLPIGEQLGQWEHVKHSSLFIVRPGLYWGPKPRSAAWKLKSRGLSPKYFEPMVPTLRRRWAGYIRRLTVNPLASPPTIPVRVTTFVGLRLAHHLGKPELACRWIERDMDLRFELESGGKRGAQTVHDRCVILHSLAGDDRLRSASYKAGKLLATSGPWEDERLYLEAMPDPVDLSPPFRE
jgi:hypothetical protein